MPVDTGCLLSSCPRDCYVFMLIFSPDFVSELYGKVTPKDEVFVTLSVHLDLRRIKRSCLCEVVGKCPLAQQVLKHGGSQR